MQRGVYHSLSRVPMTLTLLLHVLVSVSSARCGLALGKGAVYGHALHLMLQTDELKLHYRGESVGLSSTAAHEVLRRLAFANHVAGVRCQSRKSHRKGLPPSGIRACLLSPQRRPLSAVARRLASSGRSWVSYAGLTPDLERVEQEVGRGRLPVLEVTAGGASFVHLSFQEYLAAEALAALITEPSTCDASLHGPEVTRVR